MIETIYRAGAMIIPDNKPGYPITSGYIYIWFTISYIDNTEFLILIFVVD